MEKTSGNHRKLLYCLQKTNQLPYRNLEDQEDYQLSGALVVVDWIKSIEYYLDYDEQIMRRGVCVKKYQELW